MLELHRIEVLTADIVIAARRRRIAFELADDRPGVDMIDAGEAHPLGDDAERDAMQPLPRIRRMSCTMQMQDHVVAARPLRHRLDRSVSDHQIDHDDDRTELPGEIGALIHVLHRRGSDVEIRALHLAGRRLRAVDRLHAVEKAIAPMHEGLGVDVFVVLAEIEATLRAPRKPRAHSCGRTGRASVSRLRRAAAGRTCRAVRARPRCRSRGPGTSSRKRREAACPPAATPSAA